VGALTEKAPTTAVPTTTRPGRDWRPSPRAQALTLAAGGGVYALSHALNLLGSTPRLDSWWEITAKYLFAAGALLIGAGLGAVLLRFARSFVGVLSVGLIRFGMLFILLSAYSVLFVFPLYGWEGLAAIDERAGAVSLLALPTVLGGPILLAIAGLRHRVVPVPIALALLVAAVLFPVSIAVPELEAPIAIGTTILNGLAYAALGAHLARRR
jgi:hypothetical protein